MRDWWFYPLAPAVIFLSGVFLLSLTWRSWSSARRTALSIGLVLLVFVNLASRIAAQQTAGFFDNPTVFSIWNDHTALTLRLDGLSLAFLFIPILLLLAVFLSAQARQHLFLFAFAGTAALIFSAANGLALNYAIVFFEIVGAVFWYTQRQASLATLRLFLALLTVSILTLAGLGFVPSLSMAVLGFILWLRAGLMPFVEVSLLKDEANPDIAFMVWLALSTATSIYIAARFLLVPLSTLVLGLMVIIMLLNAFLAWESQPRPGKHWLMRLILTQPALALLIAPISAQVSATMSLVYTLAFGVLWLSPRLGLPNFLERHWLWVYTPPILATISLIGLPYTFGWIAHYQVYVDLLARGANLIVLAVLLAEGLAFSVLFQYWTNFLQEKDAETRSLWASLVLVMPFLVPGVAGVLFQAITGLTLERGELNAGNAFLSPTMAMILVWTCALGLGLARPRLQARLGPTSERLAQALSLEWLWPQSEKFLAYVGRSLLYLRAMFEGAHYVGWAILIALAGFLVVVLS